MKLKGRLTTARRDWLVVHVCDPHWLVASWTLSKKILDRAEAALGIEWHQAVPVIRVFDVTSDDAGTSNKIWLRDVEIHGDVDHWYVPVDDPPRAFRLQIGYRTPSGAFFVLAKSNKVTTSNRTAMRSAVDADGSGKHRNGRNGAIYAGRTSSNELSFPSTPIGRCGPNGRNGHASERNSQEFEFHLETELIIYGTTHPRAVLTMLGEPVQIDKDGRFSLRCQLPNGRQVIPAVAITPNGSEQRTIVLGIERNTKELEPRNLEENGL